MSRRSFPPPPTRFGQSNPVQPKAAAPGHKGAAIPPTKFGPQPSAQRRPSPPSHMTEQAIPQQMPANRRISPGMHQPPPVPAVPTRAGAAAHGVIQRVTNSESTGQYRKPKSSRIASRRDSGRHHPYGEDFVVDAGTTGVPRRPTSNRLASQLGTTGTGRTTPPPQLRRSEKLWNGGRTGFDESTWTDVLKKTTSMVDVASGLTVYQCQYCNNHFPRGKDLTRRTIQVIEAFYGPKPPHLNKDRWIDTLNVMSLEHNINWETYIRSYAVANDEGEITQEAAHEAYNEVDNLKPYCKFCNSSLH